MITVFGYAISFDDFLPPFLKKAFKKIYYKLSGRVWRYHPFDVISEAVEPKWILDIGANQGDIAKLALLSFPRAKVICFEPVTSTFELLKSNLNPYKDRVFLNKYALGSEAGQVEINLTSFHGANSIHAQSEFHKFVVPHVKEIGKETIEVKTLDSVFKQFPTDHIDIMKIDVEGFEAQVLRGGRQCISQSVDTIIIEIALMRDQSWDGQIAHDIFNEMKTLGFRLIRVMDMHYAKLPGQIDEVLIQMDCVFRNTKNTFRSP